MDILITIGLLLLALSILIVIHELGHFWAARMFKMRVEKFFLFFYWKFKLFSVKKGETEYGIGWIPLGGFVKISGMMDESMDTEQMKEEPKPWEFRSKPTWQRLIVMLGGIIMNIILGCVIFIGIKYVYGEKKIPISNVREYGIFVRDSSAAFDLGFKTGDVPVTYMGDSITWFSDAADPNNLVDRGKYYEVMRNGSLVRIDIPDDYLNDFIDKKQPSLFEPDGPPLISVIDSTKKGYEKGMPMNGFLGGLRDKDKVLMIDSVPIERWSQVSNFLQDKPNQEFEFIVLRNDKELRFQVSTDSSSKVGIGMNDSLFYNHVEFSFAEAIPRGIGEAFSRMMGTVKGLVALVTGNADPQKSMSGPVAIAGIYGNFYRTGGWAGFWVLTGMLSMVLAVMNLLPIPVLDGGQVLILIIEAIIGREIPPMTKEWILRIGFFLVVALMAFVFINDFIRLGSG